ncbi:MAG: restriction endonuclease [Desulfovibrionales bacterium]|nr:restriction endonuclease [Desulfovibrionales bacterium]
MNNDQIQIGRGDAWIGSDITATATKNHDQIQVGQAQAYENVSGTRILKYTVEMFHRGLNEHKIVSAPEIDMLENKANLQAQKWTEKWELLESKRRISEEKEANIEEANSRTEEVLAALKSVENLLLHTLSINDTVDWETLKKKEGYPKKMPSKPTKASYKEYPSEPSKKSPQFTFFEKLFRSKKESKLKELETKYLSAIADWEEQKKSIDKYNYQLDADFEKALRQWEHEVSEWEKQKQNFIQQQADFNSKIDKMKDSYLTQDVDSIVEYCDMVLNNSDYPKSFPKSFELEYNPDNRILIVEYELPSIDCFPKIKEVKYIAARKELKESYIAESQINKMFDEAIYKITLRSIHELFEADAANAIDAISFNGWVKAINKATGKEENNCILSIQVKKSEFMGIDLRNVEPKTCFKNLKGVASSKLSSLTPVQPILQISRMDKRFVQSYDVASQLDTTTNIAAMDWEDFEHLIRELFEKEFQTNGGECKVTRASRDGGVDAIAFDPDPIRGGKIVIQAKRYTNTVGVSAVRDLYGTVVNEGATKGILVSTADYGPDAYEFAKGKPLTLLNGSNLLHLLEKHGHHAKIDLREAKKIIAEKEK